MDFVGIPKFRFVKAISGNNGILLLVDELEALRHYYTKLPCSSLFSEGFIR